MTGAVALPSGGVTDPMTRARTIEAAARMSAGVGGPGDTAPALAIGTGAGAGAHHIPVPNWTRCEAGCAVVEGRNAGLTSISPIALLDRLDTNAHSQHGIAAAMTRADHSTTAHATKMFELPFKAHQPSRRARNLHVVDVSEDDCEIVPETSTVAAENSCRRVAGTRTGGARDWEVVGERQKLQRDSCSNFAPFDGQIGPRCATRVRGRVQDTWAPIHMRNSGFGVIRSVDKQHFVYQLIAS